MSHWIVDVLTDPDGFFRRRAEEPPGLKNPLLLVFLTGIITASTTYLSLTAITPVLPSGTQGIMEMVGIGAAVFTLLVAPLIWILQAIIFYALSSFFRGSGDLKKTLEAVGYGYLPGIFSALIGLVLTYSFLSTFTFPPIDITDPAAAAALQEMIQGSPTMLISRIFGLVFLVWTANIWIFGMKYARTLTIRDATIVVVIPVALYIVVQIVLPGVL